MHSVSSKSREAKREAKPMMPPSAGRTPAGRKRPGWLNPIAARGVAAGLMLASSLACDDDSPSNANGNTPPRQSSNPRTARSGTPPAQPQLPSKLESQGQPSEPSSQPQDAGAPSKPWEGPWMVVTVSSTGVYTDPVFDRDRKIGYVRNGGKVPVKPDPLSKDNCSGDWYQVVGGGYICGTQGTTDPDSPKLKFTLKPPDLDSVLPYKYARNAKNGTPLYKSVPSREQMYEYEPYLEGAKRARREAEKKRRKQRQERVAAEEKKKQDSADDSASESRDTVQMASYSVDGGAPDALRKRIDTALADAGIALPESEQQEKEPEKPWWQQENIDDRLHEVTLDQLTQEADGILAKRMVKGFYIAIDKTFQWNKRSWYKSTKGLVAPVKRFWRTSASEFKGVELDGDKWKLPVAWVYGGRKRTTLYELGDNGETLQPSGTVKRFKAIQLSGRTIELRGQSYRGTADGLWLKDHHVRVTSPHPPPRDLAPHERWLDINLDEQTLVAFEGARPMYATLISSGKESRIEEKDHRTPRGQYRIREKHVTTTMDGNGTAAGDLPYSIEDVPYVMYFHKAYAVHGAFWHRNYGVQMSHGCVNLAPLDAKHLFFFTSPEVPEGWHGVWSAENKRPGSRIVVHE